MSDKSETADDRGYEPWERVTIRMPESMIDDLDDVAENGTAANRSDAIRTCVDETDLEAMFQ